MIYIFSLAVYTREFQKIKTCFTFAIYEIMRAAVLPSMYEKNVEVHVIVSMPIMYGCYICPHELREFFTKKLVLNIQSRSKDPRSRLTACHECSLAISVLQQKEMNELFCLPAINTRVILTCRMVSSCIFIKLFWKHEYTYKNFFIKLYITGYDWKNSFHVYQTMDVLVYIYITLAICM